MSMWDGWTDDEEEPAMKNQKVSVPLPESSRQVAGEHYTRMRIQPWDVIDTFTDPEFAGYHRGVALSYVMRAGQKGDIAEDFEKAAHHLMKAAEELRKRRNR